MHTTRKTALSVAAAVLATSGTSLASEEATEPPSADHIPLSIESLAGIWKVDSESATAE